MAERGKAMRPFVKRLEYGAYHSDGEPVIFNLSSNRIKTASAVDSEIIKWAESNPNPRNTERLIATALGVHEGFGPNVNGDSFYEEDMESLPEGVYLANRKYEKPIYTTFVDFARLFQHHKNRPHDKSYGDVMHSHLNKRMRRIELVLDFYVDDPGNEELLNNMEHGIYPDVSMGFRCVPGDVCPICKNFDRPFPSRAYYCDHLKHNMLQVDPKTGILIHARNHNGYFFDISVVRKHADRTAGGLIVVKPRKDMQMAKVASEVWPEFSEYSSKLAEDDGSLDIVEAMEGNEKERVAEDDPGIDYRGIIENDPDPFFREFGLPLLGRTDIPLDKSAMDYIAESYKPEDIVATFAGVGIIPKPEEYQYMLLTSVGQNKYAEYLRDNKIVFDDTVDYEPDYTFASDKGAFNPKLASALREGGILDNRSLLPPFLMARATMVKEAIDFGSFHEKYPIIGSVIPKRKVPEDHQSNLIARGINQSSVGGYYTRNPNPIMNDGRYISAKPPGATSKIQSNPLVPLAIIAALYAGSRWLSGLTKSGPLGAAMSKNPGVAAGVFGASAALSWLIGRAGLSPGATKTSSAASVLGKTSDMLSKLRKDYLLHLLGGVATSYGLASRSATKREMGIQPGYIEQMAEKNPLIGTLVGAALIKGSLTGGKSLVDKFASEDLVYFEDGVLRNDTILERYDPGYIDEMARKSLSVSALRLRK